MHPLHLLTFFLPTTVIVYLLTGPHSPWVALAASLLVLGPLALDVVAPAERRAPNPGRAQLYDGILIVLWCLHLGVMALLPWYVATAGMSLGSVVAVFLVANTSAQGIVLAHELIHRPRKLPKTAGRILLAGVLYEHFFTEHLRGHHRLVATTDDPATARHGERFFGFLLRTVPGQFASAWALDRRRVLQGLAMGWGMALAVGLLFGPWGVVAHVGQAVGAVVLLEAVNFIEHWGLQRGGDRVQLQDSWDSEGMLTYFMLIGLARHGDHHANAGRPWQTLRLAPQTPKMPWGYLATAYCAVFADRLLLPRLDRELRTRRLGPYADG